MSYKVIRFDFDERKNSFVGTILDLQSIEFLVLHIKAVDKSNIDKIHHSYLTIQVNDDKNNGLISEYKIS